MSKSSPTSRMNRGNRVEPYNTRMRARSTSTSTCSIHPGQRYQKYCKTCCVLACTKCVSQFHSGHIFSSIYGMLSISREKAISNLKELTEKIKPRVIDDYEKTKKSKTEALQTIESVEKELRDRSKLLHEMVDIIFKENMSKLTKIKEKTIMPLFQDQMKKTNDLRTHVEKTITDYENILRTSDPFHLISFMNERASEEMQSMFPSLVMTEISLPKFQAVSLSRETMQGQFGSVIHSKSRTQEAERNNSISNSDGPDTNKTEIDNNTKTSKELAKEKKISLLVKEMKPAERFSAFTINTKAISEIYLLRHFSPGKVYVNGRGRFLHLIDKYGNIIRTIDVQCWMYITSGMFCTNSGELVFSDQDGRKIKKITNDFRVTTFFTTGNSQPRSISQLGSGEWVIGIPEEGVVRVYDGAGKVVREIGKGHLNGPLFVTVNRVNDDICVSDFSSKVVVFNRHGGKRFTYTYPDLDDSEIGGPSFSPHDLCCDALGNILIADQGINNVHILDRDGNFIQFLVAGEGNILFPNTIDINDRGCAVVGESTSLTVKVFEYLS